MTLYKLIAVVAYQLFIVSYAHYSVWNFIYGIKSNKDNSNKTTVLMSNIAISLLLIFVTFSNTMLIVQSFNLVELEVVEYFSVFYGITLIALLAAAAYCIVGDYVVSEKLKRQELIFRINTFVIILTALILVLATVISDKAMGTNYIMVTNHYYLPVFTLLIPVLIIIDLLVIGDLKFKLKWNTTLILSGVILGISDLIFLQESTILLSILFYALYSFYMFKQETITTFNNEEGRQVCLSLNEFASKYKLTDRELQVIKLTRDGLTNNQIAEILFISIYTVKNHMQRIFSKLDIDNRHKLIQMTTGIKFEE